MKNNWNLDDEIWRKYTVIDGDVSEKEFWKVKAAKRMAEMQ